MGRPPVPGSGNIRSVAGSPGRSEALWASSVGALRRPRGRRHSLMGLPRRRVGHGWPCADREGCWSAARRDRALAVACGVASADAQRKARLAVPPATDRPPGVENFEAGMLMSSTGPVLVMVRQLVAWSVRDVDRSECVVPGVPPRRVAGGVASPSRRRWDGSSRSRSGRRPARQPPLPRPSTFSRPSFPSAGNGCRRRSVALTRSVQLR